MTVLSLRQATKAVFNEMAPQFVSPDGKERSWITRAGNFAVCVSDVEPGAVLKREDEPEEHMVIIPPGGASATFEVAGKTIEARPDSLTIVPPGASKITATSRGTIARIFSKASKDIIALAHNNAVYADGAPELAYAGPWPAPYDGFRLRHYPLAQYADAKGPRMQARPFRSTNMLVNLHVPYLTRRGTTGLSPHSHDDFEQASLCFSGSWVHHMRYNWGADAATWWPDDHSALPTPSVIIIPARAIHTSQDVGIDGPESSLYDIFCPPRMAFAAKKGFCLNDDEYPLPADADATAIPARL
jgi:hypothetical protein